ncbi:MAG: GNAT family N-acetyltransferase [Betaproteobacteria bacterium]
MKLALLIPASNTDYDAQINIIKEHLPREAVLIREDELTLDWVARHKIDVLVASGLSEEWCYLLRGLEVVSIVFGSRLAYINLADIVIDYKHAEGDHYFTGPSVDFTHEPPDSFIEIVALAQKLEWDSQFFGVNVAYISCLHLSDNIYKAISRFVTDNNIDLIEYLCNCHDRRSVLIAEKEGFTFADIRLTFIKKLTNFEPSVAVDGFALKRAGEEDIPQLERMAGQLYVKSRYFFDEKFGADKAEEFYKSWIRKAVRGQFDDECWCLTQGTQVIAFCSFRYTQGDRAQIGLMGVHESFAGMGVGKLMIDSVIKILVAKGVEQVVVVTQGRNYPAQNLYQSAGFRTQETQLWYHKWR